MNHPKQKKDRYSFSSASFFSVAGMILTLTLVSACARQLTMNDLPVAATDSDDARKDRAKVAAETAAAEAAKKAGKATTGTNSIPANKPNPKASPGASPSASPGATPSATPSTDASPAPSPTSSPSAPDADAPQAYLDILADDYMITQIADYEKANNVDCSTRAGQIQLETPGKTGNFTIFINCMTRVTATTTNTTMTQLSLKGTIDLEKPDYHFVPEPQDFTVQTFTLTK